MSDRPDPAEFGLTPSLVDSPAGQAMVWHRPSPRPDDERPPLVLLHGAAGSWSTWSALLRAADSAQIDLGAVLALDAPGWGSSTAVLRRETSIDDIADAVQNAVRSLGFSSARLVGHSMGGLLALHLAARTDSIAASVLALSPSSSGVIAAVDHPVRSLAGGLRELVLLRAGLRVLAPIDRGARSAVRGLQRFGAIRLLAAPLFRHPLRAPRWVMDATAEDLRPRSFTLAADALRGYRIERWKRISCPVAVAVGDRDVFVAPEDLGGLEAVVPQLTATVLTDCGHFPQVERADAVLRLLS
ncbi:alpha/beta fold hydrolase [Naasia lichenicola]|uniref:Alpha/beta hydrolase n=1 Tax=Naasia lichenicola TaxID=2565933 RepID=A0A4V3WSQ1_9MICO|nr:alpha/beta fold hydrolase [Naasia lichenicola]THG28737.1 alpha/beta hydrolase [Naasia lichenicola]